MSEPREEYAVLRPSRFRADLYSSNSRMICEGVEESLNVIIYQQTSVNNYYGRVEDCPCSDEMDRVRGCEPETAYRWEFNNTTSIRFMEEVETLREHLWEMIKSHEEPEGDSENRMSGCELDMLVSAVEEVGEECDTTRAPSKMEIYEYPLLDSRDWRLLGGIR